MMLLPLLSWAGTCGLLLVHLASASTPTTPTSEVSTQGAVSYAPAPLCSCNDTELVCSSRNESAEDEAVQLTDIVSWDCKFIKLEVSNLDVNEIAADAFKSRPDLQVVYLYSDFIETVDGEAFRGLKSLVDVDLSDNSLLSIDPLLFATNPLLKSVSLSDNALVNLKTNAPILESFSITILDLSFCKLTSLSKESFSKLPNLQSLDLSNNNLQQIQLEALESLPKLNAFNIANNRWSCDCDFKQVVEFSKTIENTDARVRCFTPDRMMVYWTNKTAEKYCPDEDPDAILRLWFEPPVDDVDEPTPENMGVVVFHGWQASRKHVIITIVGVVVGFVIFVAFVVIVVRKTAPRRDNWFFRNSLSSSFLIPESKCARDGQECSRISNGDAVNGHLYEKILEH